MRKAPVFLSIVLASALALAACSGPAAGSFTAASGSQSSTVVSAAASGTSSAARSGAASAAEALAENSAVHGEPEDAVWESAAVIPILLNGDSITADAAGVTAAGSRATITAAGTYSLSGSLADGQISVDTTDEGVVQLILNGVDLRNSTGAPLNVVNAETVVLVLAEDTENYVADGSAYVFDNPEDSEPNAAVFSQSDLTITGGGSLTIVGNYNDGLASKDGLLITGGTITVTAADDGVRGKDYVVIEGGALTVEAQGDGLKADNETEADRGYILIEAGVIQITSGGDAITAQTDVIITGGTFTLTSGGGSRNRVDADTSAKGLKAAVNVTIDGGTFTIDAADDALHSNGSLTINAGVFSLASGDDGAHADAALEVNGGDLQITESYEGLESAAITLNAGVLRIVASDDGVNVAGGNDGSGTNLAQGPGGQPGRGPGQDAFTSSGNYHLIITGGYLAVEAAGDGIDVNGAIDMSGGVVIVHGPTAQMNGALDYDATFTMTGGFLVAVGSAGMAQAPGTTSLQPAVLINLAAAQPAGALVHIEGSDGETLLTFSPSKAYQSIAFSSPELASGATYSVYTGGSSTGAAADGLYQDGTYTPGSQYASFTVASVVTQLGSGRGRP